MPVVKLITEGGNMKPGPAVAQQLGPLGINLGKLIEDVNKATAGFKGTKVPVEIDVDAKTKDYKIQVFSPPVSELVKKEAGVEKGSGEAKKTHAGNIAIEQAIKVAKTKMPDMLAKDLRAALRLVVGSCASAGILVEGKEPTEVEKEIANGVYDKEIKEERTEVSEEKKAKLAGTFKELHAKEEAEAKAKAAAEEAEAEAAKAAKEAAAPATKTVEAKAPEKKAPEKKK